MKKMIIALALFLSAGLAYAQSVENVTLAVDWDMDGLALDVDYNVLASTITDSKADYVISADTNEVCRVASISIVDADGSVSAGTATLTGTDCWGDALVCTALVNGGSGTRTLTYSSGASTTCAFKTITNLTTGVITGEGGAADTISVGYPAMSGYVYPIYGVRKYSKLNGLRYVEPRDTYAAADNVYINGTALTSVKAVDGGAFQGMSTYDMVYFTINGQVYERRLAAVASDDAATLESALPTGVVGTTTSVGMRWKKFFELRESTDAWIPMPVGEGAMFSIVDVDANTDTGGVVSSVECSTFTGGSFDPNVQVDTDTVASTSTGANTTAVDLRLAPYQYCRVGAKFGTNDDAVDAGVENINIIMVINRVP